jgi:pSer/pThr/pTyr-binding forkhead associated (FHA) protein
LLQIVLKVTSGPHEGREFSFDGHDHFIVGRAKSAQFRLSMKDQYFSRNHFLVEVNPPLCRLIDLNSMNGTFVNGKKVTSTELHDGDMIKGGDTTLRVSFMSNKSNAEAPVASAGPVVDPAPASAGVPAPRNRKSGQPTATTPQVGGDQTIVPRNWPGNPALPQQQAAGPVGMPPRQTEKKPSNREAAKPNETSLPAVVPAAKAGRELSADDRKKIESIPQPFDRYELIDELGRGGMGVVYRARDKNDGSLVALKVVLPAVAASPEDLARFIREARILKKLTDPHIVPYHDLGHARGQLYFAMTLVPGTNGQILLREHNGPLPIRRAVNIVCQLLDALYAAHQAGFVHRDVKPSNLIIEPRGADDFVWLADFGLARAYQGSTLSGLTTTGSIGGTLPFMAPEQITDYRNVTPAADQYSAAATLYYLLTREYTYDFPSDIASKLLMVLQEPPRMIQHRCPEIPVKLSAIIHKGLARLPAHRFADVAHFRKRFITNAEHSSATSDEPPFSCVIQQATTTTLRACVWLCGPSRWRGVDRGWLC